MKNFTTFIVLFILSLTTVRAKDSSESITIIGNEKWWGMSSLYALKMPYIEPILIDLSKNISTVPEANILLSSSGRYIYSDKPFTVEFVDGKSFVINSNEKLTVERSGRSLREAYLSMYQKYIKKDSVEFNRNAVEYPFVNIDGDLSYNEISELTNRLKKDSIDKSILLFSRFWQRNNGNLDFDKNSTDAKKMVEGIHESGNLAYLWVSPFVSPDSKLFIKLKDEDQLVVNPKDNSPILVEWSGGISALYDITKEDVNRRFIEKINKLINDYKIDGILFSEKIAEEFIASFPVEYAKKYLHIWNEIAMKYPSSIVEGGGDQRCNQMILKLEDRYYNWENIGHIIPSIIANSLLGYKFTAVGEDLNRELNENCQILKLRLVQLQAMMPIFSLPTDIYNFSPENLTACMSAVALNSKMKEYILAIAEESVRTGAPIIRSLEYEFPGKSFYDCKDQFMVGSKYMVAPFLTKECVREVRIPAGYWVDDQGKSYKGPRVIQISGDINRIPYFEYIKSKSLFGLL